jgi:hypothetical protein
MDLSPLLTLVFDGAPLPSSRLRPVVVGRPHPIRRIGYTLDRKLIRSKLQPSCAYVRRCL